MGEKMKIGIITWFKFLNYGTILQAVSLANYVTSLGHEVYLLDYPISGGRDGIFNLRDLKKRTVKFFSDHLEEKVYRNSIEKKKQRYHNFYESRCNIAGGLKTKKEFIDYCNNLDLIICGSDQIWNPNWYSDFYFANFDEIHTPKISYGSSIGVESIPDMLCGTYEDSIRKFSRVAVREKSLQRELKDKFNINAIHVIDPVCLLEEDQWKSIIKKNSFSFKKRYVVCYFLSDNKNYWAASRKFAQKNNLALQIIPMTIHSKWMRGNKKMDIGPMEFLSIISNAEYILTDSFHATMFSIIFKKQFYVFERFEPSKRDSQNSRITDLLIELNLYDRLLKYNSRDVSNLKNIDFEKVNAYLEQLTNESKKYLKVEIMRIQDEKI